MTVFAIALMSTLVIGALHLTTTDLQIARNHQYDEEALYIAEAGIEDAIQELRSDISWDIGFSNKEYPSGSGNTYTVAVQNDYPTVVLTSTSTVRTSYSRQIEVQVYITGPPAASPYPVRLDYWKEL